MPEIIRESGQLGALPRDHTLPALNLGAHISGTAPHEAHYGHIPVIGMLGNDKWGDCVFACGGHSTDAISFYGQGQEVLVTEAQALAGYTAETGFDPNAGPPGTNQTDNGATLQSGLDYERKHGYHGVRCDAFGFLDHTDTNQWRQALAQLGPLTIGVGVGEAEMDAFEFGQPWDLPQGSFPADENHCVLLCGYTADGLYYVYTWGGLQAVTQRWFRGAVYEAWGCVSRVWVNRTTGRTPYGVNLHTLGLEFSRLTGQPAPF